MVSQFNGKQNQNKQSMAESHNPELDSKQILVQKTNQNNCGCHSSKKLPFIGSYSQAPQWMRYQQLTIGYRINFSSFKLILKSLFMLHNQTANVWTHLLGTIILLLTASITCTDLLSMFQLSNHTHLLHYEDIHPLGSGQSFIQNITQQCLNEQQLSKNNHQHSIYSFSQSDKLAYQLCQNQSDRHQCYIKKSHQTKLRNWLEFYLGLTFDQIQQFKLIVEKKIAPEIVHQLEDKIHNNTNSILYYLQNYLHLYQPNFNPKLQQIQSKLSPYQQTDSINNHKNDSLPRWPLVFYLVCNSICLLCSVTYHLFYPLSQRAHSLCVCTDFAGISVLFGGSAIPCIYYGMYCYFQVGEIYLTGIICASMLVFGLSFTKKFQNRKSSTFRVFIYFVFACFMVTPLFHMSINELIFNNYNDSYSFVSSLQWYILGLLFFGIGGFFYASQMPNRFSRTGKYDIFGHSHHYWHIFVVMAIITIYIGCLQNYFTRKQSICMIAY